jgi:peptidoglycan/LPS O-acetylase OafA/YrhL
MGQHSSLTPPAAGGRLRSVDVLRALAALWVLLAHIHVWGVPETVPIDFRFAAFLPLEFGCLGVTMFIVISGFCIHLGAARMASRGQEVRSNWGRFWRRRFFRLYPPYLAAIGFSLAVYYLVGPVTRDRHPIDWLTWDLATHLLLVHNLFPAFSAGLGDPPFWSLGLEEQLYLLYALLLVVRRRAGAYRTVWLLLGVTALWKLGVFLATSPDAPAGGVGVGHKPLILGNWDRTWPLSFWFSWGLGALAAEAYSGAVVLPRWCYRRFAILGFVAASVTCSPTTLGRLLDSRWFASHTSLIGFRPFVELLTYYADPFFAVASFALLNRWARSESEGHFAGRWIRPLSALGLMSYSLYLTHWPLIRAGEGLFGLDTTLRSVAVRFAVYVPVCLAFGAAFFWLVERRFLGRPAARLAVAAPQAGGPADAVRRGEAMVRVGS